MLTCIACSKALEEPICETELNCGTTPRSRASKETMNNLSVKIKDLSLKLSGAYRESRPFAKWSSSGSSKGALGTLKFESLGGRSANIVLEEEEECKEWVVEVERGVVITFLSLPKSKNHLKRVRFSKEVFDKCRAQLWWLENYDKIVELFDVQRTSEEALLLLTKSEYEEKRSTREASQHSLSMPTQCVKQGCEDKTPSMEDRTKTSSSEDGDPSLSAKLSDALLVSTTDHYIG